MSTASGTTPRPVLVVPPGLSLRPIMPVFVSSAPHARGVRFAVVGSWQREGRQMREDPTAFEPRVQQRDRVPGPPRGLVITEATTQDIERCVALAELVSDGTNAEWSALFRHNIEHPDRYLVVARAGDELIGYGRTAWFDPDTEAPANAAPAGYYLVGLVVDPPWRRRGVASAIIQARLDWVAQRAPEAWYFADVQNLVSIELHERAGFVAVTNDFWFPTVTDGAGSYVLGSVQLRRG
jgi:ribosomal protein S18 acetylase RimI-like enzyme